MEILPYALTTAVALAVVLWAEVALSTAARPAAGPRRSGPERASDTANAVFKPLASLGFVAGGFAVAVEPLFAPLMVALVLSLVGDVLLIPKGRKLVFIAGIAAFLAAHLAYGWMFLRMGVAPIALVVASLAVAAVALVVWRWLAPHVRGSPKAWRSQAAHPRSGAMRVAVVAYVAVISAMVALAFGAAGAGAGALPVVAASLFWLSDLAVARHRFVKAEAANRLVGLPLYYTAQYLFIAVATWT